jgi:Domain of unknown function (DUF4260)
LNFVLDTLRFSGPCAPAQIVGGFPSMTPQTESATGFVTGSPRMLLRIEGLGVLIVALALYYQMGFSWLAFVVFFLAPDLSMLAYLAGPQAGAIGYNAAHTYVLPLALGIVAAFAAAPIATAAAIIWCAHIGFDRLLGYGLKYRTAFGDTHLGRIGRAQA